MGLTVCPAAVVAVPVEVVWGNLVQWERWPKWRNDVQVERSEPEGPATVGQTIYFAEKSWAAPCTSASRSKRSIPKDTSSACILLRHWDCKGKHTSPALPSTQPPAASNMAETSSSPQAGGVGSSKHVARKQSLPA